MNISEEALRKQLVSFVGEDAVTANESMSRHTTFRIGGPADFFITPHSIAETQSLLAFLREEGISFYIIGNGSNLLISDEGVRGVVISFGRAMSCISIEENEICAQAGAFLSAISQTALRHSLSGMEFASGIPGSLGGACVMNAGAYGGDMSQVLVSVTALDSDGQIHEIQNKELSLGYRHSIFMDNEWTVMGARLRLAEGAEEEIRTKMEELKEQRIRKQPLEYPSAGSTFKRPAGHFAGKLIMDAGLRGYRIGDACVSEKHCGFVVNLGHATAADVRKLILDVERAVYEREGVRLEPEVRFLGFA